MVATKEIEATGKKTEMEKREELAAEQSRGRSMTMRERLCRGSHWTGKRETAVRWPDVRFAPSMGPVLLITYTHIKMKGDGADGKEQGGSRPEERCSYYYYYYSFLIRPNIINILPAFFSPPGTSTQPLSLHRSRLNIQILYIIMGCHKYAQRLAGCADSIPIRSPHQHHHHRRHPSNPIRMGPHVLIKRAPGARKKERGRPRRMDQVAKIPTTNQRNTRSTQLDSIWSLRRQKWWRAPLNHSRSKSIRERTKEKKKKRDSSYISPSPSFPYSQWLLTLPPPPHSSSPTKWPVSRLGPAVSLE